MAFQHGPATRLRRKLASGSSSYLPGGENIGLGKLFGE
jgi:hypothetical protein